MSCTRRARAQVNLALPAHSTRMLAGPLPFREELGAYFASDGGEVQFAYPWDASLATRQDLSGLLDSATSAVRTAGGYADKVTSPVRAGLSIPEVGSPVQSVADQAMKSGLDAIWPTIEASIRRAVPLAVESAWPRVEAKIKPIRQQVASGITLLVAMQALTLLGVGYLAYKAAKT